MKQVSSFLWATLVLILVSGAAASVFAQNASATPDPFAVQLTSSPASAFMSFAGDVTANGRFVVFESNGDVSTEKTAARNNSDGNREIFLIDYAQRRIFQLTNTKNVPKPAASPTPTPTPTPTPSPSPTPSPVPTPADPSQVQVEISNNRPVLTFAPGLNGTGQRIFTIVFSSNAPNPASFDGVDTGGALAADGNQEIWIYQLPGVSDVDLTVGADLPLQDLSLGSFIRITDTPASRVPSPGATNVLPFVADDNREATISENGNIIAFISTRNLVPSVGNTDGNPELFFYNRTAAAFIQGTNTQDSVVGATIFSVFQQNPSLSADGSVVAFISSGNLAGNNNDDGNGHGNAEVYVANFNGSAVSNVRQATRTKSDATAATVNVLSQGRRLSRDGAVLAFESLTADPKANSTTNQSFLAVFVYTIATDTFVQVGPRALASPGDITHFPTFTDYNSSLGSTTLVFASALNFLPDGTFPTAANDSTGLNPLRQPQIFATQIPASSSNTFTRLTRNPQGSAFGGLRPLTSETRKRMAFSLGGTELGGGNADSSTEVYYLLTPTAGSESATPFSFFTGASNFPVPNASPTPTPGASPSPTPTPTPTASPTTAPGLAPGELSIIRSTVDLAPGNSTATGFSETARSPALPVELNGVSVSVNGAAAGLYFVGNSPRQINFVLPVGLAPGAVGVVINNNGTVFRSFVLIVAAQPDIFTSTADAGGRAVVVNVTNPLARTSEPFSVTSPDSTGTAVATVLEISLTGARGAAVSEVTVTIGTTAITGSGIVSTRSNPDMPGLDFINVTLPASLAGAGDVPIVVSVNKSGAAFSSRPSDTAPHITISP